MLRHAFETLGCIRVELKTDALNEKSRNAILRIGLEGEVTGSGNEALQSTVALPGTVMPPLPLHSVIYTLKKASLPNQSKPHARRECANVLKTSPFPLPVQSRSTINAT